MIHKNLTNNFIAFFLVVPLTLWFFSSLFSPVFVSALDINGFDFPESVYTDNSFKTTADDIFDKLQKNQSINDLDACVICIGSRSGLNVSLFIGVPNTQFHYSGFWGNGIIYVCDSFNGVVNYNDLESYAFTFTSNTVLPSSPPDKINAFFVHDNIYSPCYAYANPTVNMTGFYFDSKAVFSFVSPEFVAEFETVNLPFYSLDVDDFYTWLVNNDKIAVDSSGTISGKIPSYIGIQKLKSFLNFYKQFGSSNKTFIEKIASWFSFMNIVGQTKNNIAILKNTTDTLYQEYINYISGTHAYWPNASHLQERDTIDTKTDNNDLTLVTDDNTDTLDISILRDILRGVIAISNNLNEGVSRIIGALERLNFTVNVANDGGVGFDANSIWGTGDITQSENYLALTNAFMDKGVDVSAAENMQINYLENASQTDSFTVSVVMPDQYINGQFSEKTVTHTIDNTSKMYNTLLLFRKLIAFAVIAYFAIRIRFELPNLIRGE